MVGSIAWLGCITQRDKAFDLISKPIELASLDDERTSQSPIVKRPANKLNY